MLRGLQKLSKQERFKFNINAFSLELNDETLNLLVALNSTLESQNLKPVKLYTNGKNGTLYSYISKEELQKYIKTIKEDSFKEIKLPASPLPAMSLSEVQSSQPKENTIMSKETIQKISSIKPTDAKVITDIKRPTAFKLTIPIGCTNCGFVSFQTEQQYVEIEKQKQFTCPSCKQTQKIAIEGKRDRRNIGFRLVQSFFVLSFIWFVYWGHVYEITVWHKPILETFGINSLCYSIVLVLLAISEYVRQKIIKG